MHISNWRSKSFADKLSTLNRVVHHISFKIRDRLPGYFERLKEVNPQLLVWREENDNIVHFTRGLISNKDKHKPT